MFDFFFQKRKKKSKMSKFNRKKNQLKDRFWSVHKLAFKRRKHMQAFL